MVIEETRIKRASPLIGMGAIANVTVNLLQVSANKKARITKIRWNNRTGGNGVLRIGYTDNTPAFIQVLPDILMLANMDDSLLEREIPRRGNAEDGFTLDATVGAGCTGIIQAQSSVAGMAPADVQVSIEAEER